MVDGIVALMLIEWMVLILVRKKWPPGPGPLELLASIGAGAALLLALRAAMLERAWPHIAVWLLASLGCHLADLRLRWNGRRAG